MSSVWMDLAKAVGKPSADIETQAAFNWIMSEIYESDRQIAAYIRQYGVSSPGDLESLIQSGGLDGHPAWEDTIDWFNLVDYRQRMLNACVGLNGGQIK